MAALELPRPSARDILAATGSGRAQAYTRRAQLMHAVAPLDRDRGRPAERDDQPDMATLTRDVLRYVMDHPGAVCGTRARRSYSAGFRRFVLERRAGYARLDLSTFARAVDIPPATLATWLRNDDHQPARDDSVHPLGRDLARRPSVQSSDRSSGDRTGPLGQIIAAYLAWTGSFAGFCDHVSRELGIPWRRSKLARVLVEYGLRAPTRREGNASATAVRGAFQTYFPGAQWVADGTEVTVHINGQAYRFNLELVVDCASGAVCGASVGDSEDSRAVVDAFDDAVAETGGAPQALLLDQRGCNLSAAVDRGTGVTPLVHAGRGRPQTKGHVEGAFGLMSQALPDLTITAADSRSLAKAVLQLAVQCWARTLNHRPRRARAGQSRVELYRGARPTPAQRQAAREALTERSRQSLPRRRRAPLRELSRAMIATALADLGLEDRDGYAARALAVHPLEAMIAGVATYAGKQDAGTLPAGADARYLLGIVRRIAESDEGVRIAEQLWRTRTRARDQLIALFDDRVRAVTRGAHSPEAEVDALVDEALSAATGAERRVWISAAGAAIHRRRSRSDPAHEPGDPHPRRAASADASSSRAARALFRRAARRIHAARDMPYSDQLACVRSLAAELIPIAP